MAQEIDDAAVLAHMKARLAALQASIAHYEAFLGQRSFEAAPDSGQVAPAESRDQLGPGVFHGLSISEAARKFLEITKKKQKVRAICDALQQGGIESSSKNFYNNVYTTLGRTKDFIQIGKYWALAEWHPTRATAPPKPPKKARRVKKARGEQRKRQTGDSAPSGTPTSSEAA